jgi:A/G-specific adenine glycosylase
VTAALVGRFAQDIVAWQKRHGRNSLPWQNTRDPYRVWLSEIMLQQTQVVTVLDYYARFLDRFPTVAELALAEPDDVLALWSGLGYYSRARNLHRCAQDVVALHGGQFPRSSVQLQTLPGIGPSTAAAIASFCFAERVAILDGNVKRVLTRVLGFTADLSLGKNEKQLWAIATSLLPENNLNQTMPRYTQGVMDLGATICTARKPQCLICPVQGICKGFAQGQPEKYPVKTKKIKRSVEHLSLLWAQKPDGSVWLERRPVSGIWGSLYCLPIFESQESLVAFLPARSRTRIQVLPSFKHVLTHKDLHLSPVMAGFSVSQKMPSNATASSGRWVLPGQWQAIGLPAPIRKLLGNEPDQ